MSLFKGANRRPPVRSGSVDRRRRLQTLENICTRRFCGRTKSVPTTTTTTTCAHVRDSLRYFTRVLGCSCALNALHLHVCCVLCVYTMHELISMQTYTTHDERTSTVYFFFLPHFATAILCTCTPHSMHHSPRLLVGLSAYVNIFFIHFQLITDLFVACLRRSLQQKPALCVAVYVVQPARATATRTATIRLRRHADAPEAQRHPIRPFPQ